MTLWLNPHYTMSSTCLALKLCALVPNDNPPTPPSTPPIFGAPPVSADVTACCDWRGWTPCVPSGHCQRPWPDPRPSCPRSPLWWSGDQTPGRDKAHRNGWKQSPGVWGNSKAMGVGVGGMACCGQGEHTPCRCFNTQNLIFTCVFSWMTKN